MRQGDLPGTPMGKRTDRAPRLVFREPPFAAGEGEARKKEEGR